MDEPSPVQSSLLSDRGFLHGFSTRAGGVSAGAFASLNLGRNVGDDPSAVSANAARFARAIGYEPARLYEVSQVHGNTVVDLRGATSLSVSEVRAENADALIARTAGTAVAVRTADCVPVLIADPNSGAVAAVHAGWRGIVSGVIAEAVQKLEARDRGALVAAVGPSIGPCCFEVDDDVAAQIGMAAGDGLTRRRGHDKPHVDLWRAAMNHLRAARVTRVDMCTECTMCNAEKYFSYRRDGKASGRMASVIVARTVARS